MPRTPKELARIYRSTEYYEQLFRARFVRAMKSFQKKLNRTQIANAAGNRARLEQLMIAELDAALKPLEEIFVKAFMKGGEIGAEHVKETLRG